MYANEGHGTLLKRQEPDHSPIRLMSVDVLMRCSDKIILRQSAGHGPRLSVAGQVCHHPDQLVSLGHERPTLRKASEVALALAARFIGALD